MKYKLLAIDLDGTLVTSNNKISKVNLKKMKEYVDNGGKISFVTGRTIHYAQTVADQFFNYSGHKIEIICALNGSYIYDNINQQILKINTIDDFVAAEIKESSCKNKFITAFYNELSVRNNSMYINGCSNFLKKFISIFYKKKTRILLDDNFDSTRTLKINIFSLQSDKKINKYIDYIKSKYHNILVTPTKKYLYEITKKEVDKGYAIDFLINYFNIKKNEIVALGDSGNDIPMFKKVGLDIAINDKRIKKLGYKPKISLNRKVSQAIAYVIDNYVK